MAIPSGGGSEVLKTAIGQVSNATTTIFTVAAHHIITIISINIATTGSTATTFDIRIHDGTADRYVLKDESIPGNGTFIYNDKLVLQPTHILKLKEPGTQAFDYVISYIDQDWS